MVNEKRPALRIVGVVPDLFFSTRIAECAKQIGAEFRLATLGEAPALCREWAADLAVFDLDAHDQATAAIAALRTDPATRDLRIVGFYAHVHDERRVAALAAGANRALPRSAFTARLPQVLTGEGDRSPGGS